MYHVRYCKQALNNSRSPKPTARILLAEEPLLWTVASRGKFAVVYYEVIYPVIICHWRCWHDSTCCIMPSRGSWEAWNQDAQTMFIVSQTGGYGGGFQYIDCAWFCNTESCIGTIWTGERRMGGDITQEMIRRRSEHNECVLYTMEVLYSSHTSLRYPMHHFLLCSKMKPVFLCEWTWWPGSNILQLSRRMHSDAGASPPGGVSWEDQ